MFETCQDCFSASSHLCHRSILKSARLVAANLSTCLQLWGCSYFLAQGQRPAFVISVSRCVSKCEV